MAAVIICSDFGSPENSLTLFPLFPHLFPMKWRDRMPWSSFSECWALSQLFHSPLSLSSRKRVGLGIFESLEVWPVPQGLMKSHDSQTEMNTVKWLQCKTRAVFLHANWWWHQFAAWDYKREPTKLQFEMSPMGWHTTLEPFPNWDPRLLLMRAFPALLKSGYKWAQFGDVYAAISIVSISFLLVNAYWN